MPIKVTCQCGKSFSAKDELAGKAVKCPNCQQPLKIPGPAAAPAKSAAPKQPAAAKPAAGPAKTAAKTASKPAAPQAAKPAAKPAPKQASASSSGIGIGDEERAFGFSDSALSEIGLTQQAVNTRPCPGCTAPLAPDAVICIKCGFNTKLGRRMETMKVGGNKGGHEGHGAVATELMERAAVSIEEQEEEDRSKTGTGVPWWAYGLGMLAAVGFMATMMLLDQDVAVGMAAYVIMTFAFLLACYSGIRILIAAFNESVVQGILYMLVPFYALFYVITRWDKVGAFFIMNLGANAIFGLGYGVLQVAPMLKKSETQSGLPGGNPAALVVQSESPHIPAASAALRRA